MDRLNRISKPDINAIAPGNVGGQTSCHGQRVHERRHREAGGQWELSGVYQGDGQEEQYGGGCYKLDFVN